MIYTLVVLFIVIFDIVGIYFCGILSYWGTGPIG